MVLGKDDFGVFEVNVGQDDVKLEVLEGDLGVFQREAWNDVLDFGLEALGLGKFQFGLWFMNLKSDQ